MDDKQKDVRLAPITKSYQPFIRRLQRLYIYGKIQMNLRCQLL